MKMPPIWKQLIWPTFLTVMLLVGCTQSPPVKYYTLSSLTRTHGSSAINNTLAIGLGPVQLPKLIHRPQIVTRIGPNRVDINEFHRWAGSLESDFNRTLAKDLEMLLGGGRVVLHPWEDGFNPTHRVSLNVDRFDGTMPGEVILDASWTVTKLEGKKGEFTQKSVIRQPVSGNDFDALVAAQSEAVTALSRELVEAIKRLR